MPLQNGSILAGGTLTASGGSAVTYTPDGQTVPNGMHLINAAIADYRIRPNITFRYKIPVLDSMGVYSKDRKTGLLVMPKLLASGKIVFPLIRFEREVHPEMTAAEILELNVQAAQFLTDPDYAPFWATGSMA